MDVMEYVPYSGFLQNDEETVAIMAKAATIVPKACDILGISLRLVDIIILTVCPNYNGNNAFRNNLK